MTDHLVLQLLKKRDDLLASFSCTVTPEIMAELDTVNRYLLKKSSLTNFTVSFFNLGEGRFVLHQSGNNRWLHHPALDAAVVDSLSMLHKLVHPDDLIFSLKTEVEMCNFLRKLRGDQYPDTVMIFSRRLLEKDGKYRTYVHNLSVVQCNATGNPCILKIETERIPDVILPAFRWFRPSLTDYTEEHAYSARLQNVFLTHCQAEVLELLLQNLSVMDIAGILTRSPHTIKSHCQCIRAHLQVASLPGMVHMARIVKLLECPPTKAGKRKGQHGEVFPAVQPVFSHSPHKVML
jgi:DNA-binding CsgD family transcriptional regulator